MSAAPEIYTFHIGINNLYLLKTEEGGILVDAGPDFVGAWNQVIANVVGAGLAPEQVRHVLVTHFHSDHAGFARRWQELGATVHAGAGDAWHLRRGPDSYPEEADICWAWMKQQGVPDDLTAAVAESILMIYAHSQGEGGEPMPAPPPDAEMAREIGEWYPTPLRMSAIDVEPLADGSVVELGGVRVEAISTPGHTPGSMCFWQPEAAMLFTGDHLIPGVFSNPSLYFEENDILRRFRATPDYIRSCERLRGLPAKRVGSGHKQEVDDLDGMIDRVVVHHNRRLERFGRSIDITPRTVFELAEMNYPRLVRRDTWYVIAEVMGLVDVLEDEGRVLVERDGDISRVRASP